MAIALVLIGKFGQGMILYDIFSFDKTLPLHRMLPKAKLKQLFRSLDPEGLSWWERSIMMVR